MRVLLSWSAILAVVFLGCRRQSPYDNEPFPETTVQTGSTTPPPVVVTEPEPTPPPVGPGVTRAVNDRDFVPAAVAAIQAANHRIRVAQFLIYSDWSVELIEDALTEAARRGVRVQFLADETGSETEASLQSLERQGLETRLDSPEVTLHNKLIVADEVVLVGSHNFTGSAMDDNHEASMLIADADVAQWYSVWFDAVWEDPASTPEMPEWSATEIVPLADRLVTASLITCMDEATSNIDLQMYAMAYNSNYPGSDVDLLMTALEDANERGVAVRVVLDDSDWISSNDINEDAIFRLQLAGVDVWLSPAEVTHHAKVLLCDNTVIVGDANWSYSGLELYHGTSVRTQLPHIAGQYRQWMGAIRDQSTMLPPL